MLGHVTRSCLDSSELFLLIFKTTALIFQCLSIDSSKFDIDLLTSPRDLPNAPSRFFVSNQS